MSLWTKLALREALLRHYQVHGLALEGVKRTLAGTWQAKDAAGVYRGVTEERVFKLTPPPQKACGQTGRGLN